MSVNRPVKSAIALAIRHPDDAALILLVRRPPDDPELPGLWGLPAASCSPGETVEQAAHRIGAQKLGAGLRLVQLLGRGRQERPAYTLDMELWEARLLATAPRLPEAATRAVTLYADWRWGNPAELTGSARRGSLCCQLTLENWPNP